MHHVLAPIEEALLQAFAARLLAAVPAGAVRAVTLFGSRARGASDEHSDLDVAVLVAPDADVPALRRLAVDIAHDVMADRDAFDLALAPIVLPLGPEWGVRAAIARDGVPIWRAAP